MILENNVKVEKNANVPSGTPTTPNRITAGTTVFACATDPYVIGSGTIHGGNPTIDFCVVIGEDGVFGDDIIIALHTTIGDDAKMSLAHNLETEVNVDIGNDVTILGAGLKIHTNTVIEDDVTIQAGVTKIERDIIIKAGALITSNNQVDAPGSIVSNAAPPPLSI